MTLPSYRPSFPGVHVCGITPDGQNFYTEADFPTATAEEARDLFGKAKAQLELAAGEERDLVVDLNGVDSCDEDFSMTRQMLQRLQELAEAGHA